MGDQQVDEVLDELGDGVVEALLDPRGQEGEAFEQAFDVGVTAVLEMEAGVCLVGSGGEFLAALAEVLQLVFKELGEHESVLKVERYFSVRRDARLEYEEAAAIRPKAHRDAVVEVEGGVAGEEFDGDPRGHARLEGLDRGADAAADLLGADGVTVHRSGYVLDIVHLDLGRPLTPDETQELYDLVTSTIMAKGVAEDVARQVAPIPHETGVRFLNFGQLEKNPDLFKIVSAAAEKLSVDADITALRFRSDGDLVENNWKEDRNGEGYRRRILEAGFGDQLGRLEAELGPAIEDVFRGIERDFGPERVSFSRAGRDVGRSDAAGGRLGPAR